MNTKLKIDYSSGTLEVEGSEAFVQSIYDDFKDRLKSSAGTAYKDTKKHKQKSTRPATAKRAPSRSKNENGDKKTEGTNADNPTLVKNLDTSGLQEFYDRYKPRNHAEKILIFLKFLTDQSGLENPNTDHVYTCYQAVREKPALAFAQAFRDTSSKKHGFIDYKSADDITVTFIGNTHFDHELKLMDNE